MDRGWGDQTAAPSIIYRPAQQSMPTVKVFQLKLGFISIKEAPITFDRENIISKIFISKITAAKCKMLTAAPPLISSLNDLTLFTQLQMCDKVLKTVVVE